MRLLPGLLLLLLTGCATRRFEAQRLIPLRSAPVPVAIDESTALPLEGPRVEHTRDYFRLHAPALDLHPPFRMEPRVVVVHYTVIPSLARTLAYFRNETIDAGRDLVAANGRLNVGIQFIVDRDGRVYRCFPETAMVRHVIGLNHVAIGIENIGGEDISEDQLQGRVPGEGNGRQLTPAQVESNVALIRVLQARHPRLEWLIGHQEYRDFEHPRHPGRTLFMEAVAGYRTEKSDPGKRFMREVRNRLRQARGSGAQGP
ncbi:MAG: N-acetylmuramoyl-L-alanine amidase [Acidobacteria bacterium]|nr:N-acetylmuramoyl-L-alanine amidase [Acidobacteriota bacterium]